MGITAGSTQQMSNNTMQVTTYFSCQHSVTTSVTYTTTTAPVQMANGPCNSPVCQAAPPNAFAFPTIASYSVTDGKFVNKMKPELELAGMSTERCLQKFNLAEPQTQADLAEAGCSPQVIQVLSQCGSSSDRASGAANFLGHRNALAVLKQFETCVQNNGLHWQADILATQTYQLNLAVQQRLAEITSAVKRLTINAYPAPGANFPMEQGIQSYEKGLGKSELAALRSTPEGLAVLSQPLTNANILVAKTSIRHAKSSPQANAGTEQFTTAGNSDSSSGTTISLHSAMNGNISALRPTHRVLSAKMAKNSLSVDLSKADAYVNKSYTSLENPWWEAKEA